jgi:hypothetical protein
MEDENRSSFASLGGLVDIEELKSRYPRAAAYLQAKRESESGVYYA